MSLVLWHALCYIQDANDAAGEEAKFRLTPENLERWDVLGYDRLFDASAGAMQDELDI